MPSAFPVYTRSVRSDDKAASDCQICPFYRGIFYIIGICFFNVWAHFCQQALPFSKMWTTKERCSITAKTTAFTIFRLFLKTERAVHVHQNINCFVKDCSLNVFGYNTDNYFDSDLSWSYLYLVLNQQFLGFDGEQWLPGLNPLVPGRNKKIKRDGREKHWERVERERMQKRGLSRAEAGNGGYSPVMELKYSCDSYSVRENVLFWEVLILKSFKKWMWE